MATASTPLPREVEAVLAWWLPRLRSLLDQELRSVPPSGSVSRAARALFPTG